MEKNSIRIQKRIPPLTYEMAMIALLDGSLSNEYIWELAAHECEGAVRLKKSVTVIKFLTHLNPMLQYIKEHSQEFEAALKRKEDRNLMFMAQLAAVYPFVYDIICAFGRTLHAQDEVSGRMIVNKLGEKYGCSSQLNVSFRCVVPMMVESGFLERKKPGIYGIGRFENLSDTALNAYKEAFLLNNPNIDPKEDYLSNPFFEYIKN